MKSPKTTHNAILKWVFVVFIFIIAGLNWFLTERAENKPSDTPSSHSSVPQNTISQPAPILPDHLGQYDTVMAEDQLGQNKNSPVDYYMLALSWSPAFCDLQQHKNGGNVPKHLKYQCANSQPFGWVIHGLWAQSAKAKTPADHPRFCQGDLPMLPEALIKQYLPESPGANLLQGQWEKHGACAFQNAEQYFAKQKALFNQLVLPNEEMPRKALFQWVKNHNPSLKNTYLGASKNELYICYNKQWNVIDCPR